MTLCLSKCCIRPSGRASFSEGMNGHPSHFGGGGGGGWAGITNTMNRYEEDMVHRVWFVSRSTSNPAQSSIQPGSHPSIYPTGVEPNQISQPSTETLEIRARFSRPEYLCLAGQLQQSPSAASLMEVFSFDCCCSCITKWSVQKSIRFL